MPDQPTIRLVVEDALDAYAALTEVGEAIDDEWSYIGDLRTAWTERLEAIAAARSGEVPTPEVEAAVRAAIAEIERIADPHRAIDWLSTFPQVICLALGEQP